MILYTGDIHGSLSRIAYAVNQGIVKAGDTLVVLGDAGFNYFGNSQDKRLKYQLGKYGVTIFCIHGNHEMRPETISSYKTKIWNGGTVFCEEQYPYLLFAKDAEIYNLAGRKTIVCGGAYSVDKYIRLQRGSAWFADEQPSAIIKSLVEAKLDSLNWDIDQILTHTCPSRYIPVEAFLSGVDQSTVDQSTEVWLDSLADKLKYRRWLCGHWHIDKRIDNFRFVMQDIIE